MAVNAGEVEGGAIDHCYRFRLRDEKTAADTHTELHYFAKGKTHLGRIYAELGVDTFAGAVAAAEERRLLR